MSFTHGNAASDGAAARSWFVGDLAAWSSPAQAAGAFGLRESRVVEMKWGVHRAGDARPEWAECSQRHTMSLLVRGRFLLRFRSPEQRETVTEHRLLKEGDYAIWGTDLEHTWVVEEDSVILTVRWLPLP